MWCMSLESRLVKQSKIVDWVDGFVGPLATMMYLSGSESLQSAATILNVAELCLLKIPFTLSYIAKTGDVHSLLYFAPKELFSNLTPYGGFLDIIPTYYLRVDHYLSKQ